MITLLGNSTVNVEVGNAYTDAGATALDDEDGVITANIVVVGAVVNTGAAGNNTVTYNVTDSAGNAAVEVTRSVVVSNPPPPPKKKSGGGIAGPWEVAGLIFVGLLALRRRRIRISLAR